MKKVRPIVKLAADFAEVKRTVGYRDGHLENDAEHSFQLAITSWCANKQYNLGLNDELILKFALIHDLVELYAGDTDAYDYNKIQDKKIREEKALKTFKKSYKPFEELIGAMERYESKKDVEAQLVYMIDKFLPDINIHHGKGSYYGAKKVTIDDWEKWLFNKIDYKSLNPKLKPIFDETVKETKKDFQKIFYK